MASGWWNMLDHHKMECLELYKQCHGKVFDFCACYKHLKDKNQFSAFWTYCKGEILGTKPTGKRRQDLPKLMECLSRQLSKEVAKNGKKFGDRNSIVSAAHASPGESGGTNNTSYAEW